MRKLNTILSVLLLFICLLHGLMGSFMLLGISSGAGKFLAWIGVGILAAHTVLGLLLTAQTFRASRSGGKLYGKQNALFWARRTSGLAILLMLFFQELQKSLRSANVTINVHFFGFYLCELSLFGRNVIGKLLEHDFFI